MSYNYSVETTVVGYYKTTNDPSTQLTDVPKAKSDYHIGYKNDTGGYWGCAFYLPAETHYGLSTLYGRDPASIEAISLVVKWTQASAGATYINPYVGLKSSSNQETLTFVNADTATASTVQFKGTDYQKNVDLKSIGYPVASGAYAIMGSKSGQRRLRYITGLLQFTTSEPLPEITSLSGKLIVNATGKDIVGAKLIKDGVCKDVTSKKIMIGGSWK